MFKFMIEDQKQYTRKELEKKLTAKQKAFCHEYIIDWNGSRACRAAGYSEKTANKQASENKTKPDILQYIDYIKNDFEKESGLSKLMMLNELKKTVSSSIRNLHNDWITRKDFEDLKKNDPDLLDCIQEIDTKVIKKVAKEFNPDNNEFENVPYEIEYVKIKMHDKLKAIEMINRMMGWNEPDKHTHNVTQEKQYYDLGDGQKIFF